VVILADGNAQEDISAARALARQLSDEGLTVFVDAEREISLGRARRLETEIRAADAIIPILSPNPARDEMMSYALELAGQKRRPTGRRPVIFPLSEIQREMLPRQAAMALHGVEFVTTGTGSNPDQRAARVVAAIKEMLANC
jgi:hypothetical protein